MNESKKIWILTLAVLELFKRPRLILVHSTYSFLAISSTRAFGAPQQSSTTMSRGAKKNRGGRFYALFRFHSLFPSGKESRIHVLPGNHDMGFHYALSPYLDKRFKSAFKTKAVQLKVAKLICVPDFFLGYRPRSICDDKQHGL